MFKLPLVTLAIVCIFSCKGQKDTTSMDKIAQEALFATWYFSTQSEGDQSIFVTDHSSLPPARFRENLIFETENHRVSKTIPGPTDKPKIISGKWEWLGKDRLILSFERSQKDTLLVQQLSTEQFIFMHKN